MKRTIKAARRHSQRGSVAVEAAFVLPLLVLFLGLPSVFLAVYFYTYSAAQKAVHDAALYLSTAPRLEMTTAGPDGGPAALGLAKTLVTRELAGLSRLAVAPEPGIVCAYKQPPGNIVSKPCTTTNNQSSNQKLVQLTVSIDLNYINPLTGTDSGLMISPYATVHYMGN